MMPDIRIRNSSDFSVSNEEGKEGIRSSLERTNQNKVYWSKEVKCEKYDWWWLKPKFII